jgi:hypothetical protein
VPFGPLNLNVEVLMVAGFIALLNVALTVALLGQIATFPSAGVVSVTVGGDSGSPGFPALAFLSESPHPTVKLNSRIAMKPIT